MSMENIGEEMNQFMHKKNWHQEVEKMMQIVMQDSDVQTFLEENKNQLTQTEIDRSYSKLYEFVQEKQKFLKQDSDMIAPGYEPQLFMNFHYIDVTYVPTKALLQQQKQQAIQNRIQVMDLPKEIREASFDDFEITTEREKALQAAFSFVSGYKFQPKKFHKGLYLQGSFGVGKSYLLGAIAHELAKSGFQTLLLHFPTFVVEMKQSIGQNNTGAKLDQVKKAPILMLDDIGADSMSSWIRDDVLGVVLQYRMQENLPTFFSSNLSMEQLETEHLRITQRGEDEPLKAKRIMERVRYLSEEFEMIGLNRRNN